MNADLIQSRLKEYQLQTMEDEENALKEIMQEIALYALSTTGFFTKAVFQGGTALRVLHQLPRFSEDLDFLLNEPDSNFAWQDYIEEISDVFRLYGIEPEVKDRSKATDAVQKMFLKDNSIGKLIELDFAHHAQRKLMIKFEIDTNPPLASASEMQYLDFPVDFMLMSQDLPSNFAGKCHALLCRPYVKGRDWFDFSWYVARACPINFAFLSNALNQMGPWAGEDLHVDAHWLKGALENKIREIDWSQATQEVRRFVAGEPAKSLDLWSEAFFLSKVQKLFASLL